MYINDWTLINIQSIINKFQFTTNYNTFKYISINNELLPITPNRKRQAKNVFKKRAILEILSNIGKHIISNTVDDAIKPLTREQTNVQAYIHVSRFVPRSINYVFTISGTFVSHANWTSQSNTNDATPSRVSMILYTSIQI